MDDTEIMERIRAAVPNQRIEVANDIAAILDDGDASRVSFPGPGQVAVSRCTESEWERLRGWWDAYGMPTVALQML